ncbi:hypothetical protein RJ639_028541 [Escallonia herrerae]|uniref:DUF4220 domain-containing protein n=1 Tax=Escallonia herrerae TaxID=1293975 RepID=A0AA89BD15_9ASTE|nr:hypothetical protein RJ639_028541 [Escallonia herrerae]
MWRKVFPTRVKKVWNDWELRVLILLSLASQVVLVLFGNKRKYMPKTRIRVALWSAYLTADWMATVALGVISRNVQQQQGCNPEQKLDPDHVQSLNELMSFWAPFLLLHLGGPDTITAYAMEDNELWLRHLAGLVIQTGVAVYIFLMAWPGSTWLPILSLLILNSGLIKYGERTWALRSANTEHFRDSMLTSPDPGPNYAKFMEEFTLKKAEGFHVKADEVIEIPVLTDSSDPNAEDKLICEAYNLFQIFKRLFVDLILSFQDKDSSQRYFQKLNAEKAFHVIEVELGFGFDMLYTKAPMAYTVTGCVIRAASFSCTLLVLAAFVFLCDKSSYKHVDLIITYLLLVVAVLLDIYAVIVLLDSDWMDRWLSKHNKTRSDLLAVSSLRRPKKLWWSNLMAQYNVLSVCLRDKPAMCQSVQNFFQIDDLREKHRYKTYSRVSRELKKLIFDQFNTFAENSSDLKALCTTRGSFALRNDCHKYLKWSTSDVEFDQSILIWHIATDLCYYMDGGENLADPKCEESKDISDYMMYLLVMCPYMLPIGIGMIRFRDTCAEAREFFQEKSPIYGKAEACRKLLQVNTEVLPAKVKGDRSKSVLFDACRLAKSLRAMEGRQWEVASHVWVEMLAYAATHCRGNHHAQQLRKGGELLTHVWLLMAHLGITEQFQISEGHARAKLTVK